MTIVGVASILDGPCAEDGRAFWTDLRQSWNFAFVSQRVASIRRATPIVR